MLLALPIECSNGPLDPPDLLARLAERGVRLVDTRRHLVLEAPREAFESPDWPALEATARRSASALQTLSVLVGMTRADTEPQALVDRMLSLPAACLPVLVEALGGLEHLDQVAAEMSSEAHLDLCYAAYLQALSYQVAHGLGEEDEEDDEDEGGTGTSGVPEVIAMALRREGAGPSPESGTS